MKWGGEIMVLNRLTQKIQKTFIREELLDQEMKGKLKNL